MNMEQVSALSEMLQVSMLMPRSMAQSVQAFQDSISMGPSPVASHEAHSERSMGMPAARAASLRSRR